jgi:hypothetical protein
VSGRICEKCGAFPENSSNFIAVTNDFLTIPKWVSLEGLLSRQGVTSRDEYCIARVDITTPSGEALSNVQLADQQEHVSGKFMTRTTMRNKRDFSSRVYEYMLVL